MELPKPPHHPDVRHDQELYAKLISPNKRDGSVAAREKARLAKIPGSPTSREPSDGDVESFDESYKKLGLHVRWGRL